MEDTGNGVFHACRDSHISLPHAMHVASAKATHAFPAVSSYAELFLFLIVA